MKKKIIAIGLILLLVLMLPASAFSAENTDVVGDYNNDGVTNEADAIYLLRHSIFGGEAYPVTKPADYNGDGLITNIDALYVYCFSLYGEEFYPLIPYDEP